MKTVIEEQSEMVQSNGMHCRENGTGFHDKRKDFGSDFSALRRATSIDKKQSSVDGYDSGIGCSPLASSLSPQPPQTLTLSSKPGRQRRRKRGSSTAAQSFNDVFERTGRVLGSGAFSSVEVCAEKKTKKEYAVKIIDVENWYARKRVLQEVEILCRGKGHPNIIQFERHFEEENQFYVVFEMMRGGALIDHIESLKTFTEKQASIVVKGVASALKHLHGQGIAHRDLKFENILCGDNFTEVKVCDFDLGGQKFDMPDLSTPLMDSPVGSAEFMAPEVVSLFEGNHSVYDKSCDLWSLGVLIYIMIYGRPSFTGRCGLNCGWDIGEECRECQDSLFRNITSSELHFDEEMGVSDSVKHLITSLLQKDPQRRLTAQQVLEHEWVVTEGTDIQLYTPQQLKRNKSSAMNLYAFSSQANEHFRRINSNHSLANHNSPVSLKLTEDPLDLAMQSLDIGESWFEESDDEDNDSPPLFFSSENESPPLLTPQREPSPGLSPPLTPSDPDNTPVQSAFVYPDPCDSHHNHSNSHHNHYNFTAYKERSAHKVPPVRNGKWFQKEENLCNDQTLKCESLFDERPSFYFSSDEED